MTTAMTRAELQAWIEQWWDAPDAQALADFLGIELAEPDPEPPVGQRRRSADGCEAVKTQSGSWFLYQRIASPEGRYWRFPFEVADWEVITDAPEVPEDVIEAAAQLIAADVCPCDDECDSGCIGTGDRLARLLADAGLLVGTKCNREHLPSHSVRICLATISDDFLADLARGAGSPIGPVADAAYRERDRRRRRGGDGMTDYNDIEETA